MGMLKEHSSNLKFNIKNLLMFFQHIYDKSLAQSSYLIGCQAVGEAIVIDPKRDIDPYLQLAKENNLTITHITENAHSRRFSLRLP